MSTIVTSCPRERRRAARNAASAAFVSSAAMSAIDIVRPRNHNPIGIALKCSVVEETASSTGNRSMLEAPTNPTALDRLMT